MRPRLQRPLSSALLLVLGTLTSQVAMGQAQSPRDRLIELATIEVTSELCKTELSEEQSDAITAIRNTMLDEGTVSADDITAVRDQLQAAMQAQVPAGLCKPGGPGLAYYNQKLGTLGVK